MKPHSRLALALAALLSLSACKNLRLDDSSQERLKTLTRDKLACLAARPVLGAIPMESPKLYVKSGERCRGKHADDLDTGIYFADSSCKNPVNFHKADFDDFCKEVITQPPYNNLGNPAQAPAYAGDWTLWPSAKLPGTVIWSRNLTQPFMTRRTFQRVPVRDRKTIMVNGQPQEIVTLRGNGTCELEMRIYRKDLAATNLTPVIAIHGGKWRYRGLGFTGMEGELSAFTDGGFVVFAPFYRLVTESNGNIECNGASFEDMVADTSAMLDWVKAHANEFGASPDEKPRLIGGSAGAHLATWLLTQRPTEVGRALLMYPPIDFRDYIEQARVTGVKAKGYDGIETLLNVNFDTVPLDDPRIMANTFTRPIAANPQQYPPLMIMHGISDTLVPARQAVRLCNALSGNPDSGPARLDGGNPAAGSYMQRYQCDQRDSRLYLFAEAEHGLDACMPKLACPAGSKKSQKAIRDSIKDAVVWLKEAAR